MITIMLLGLCYFSLGIVYASFVEYYLHRDVMHKIFVYHLFGKEHRFSYPFQAHAVTHHGTFKADKTYILQNHEFWDHKEHEKTITMAWWNGVVLIFMASLPFILWSILRPSWFLVLCIALAVATYYGVYEYFHFCMHKPMGRWFEKTSVYKWMDEHHRLHHKHPSKNLNVILPLPDLCFGTLCIK